eukprot:Plantae.Rhodophyta-Hildenbrandia_rubra.ctg11800.p1 GENE.Plantae.Rhodophyta-Hildenbrandia_rubra.ctg11800~~Plantae.Rhodophyta-Hildenbrandia_rubra.ctg11800.p1  ORF type:complete len:640 (+),score=79.01 Plantae.Rhodophyta-Hildenbrandia_rubra.ctg11800:1324-3243(+)
MEAYRPPDPQSSALMADQVAVAQGGATNGLRGGTDREAAEIERSRQPASRKSGRKNSRRTEQSADYLLNFSSYQESHSQGRVYRGRGPHRRVFYDTRSAPRTTSIPQFRRREQFIQANYRFAVDPDANINWTDANAFVEWGNIDLVFVLRSVNSELAGDCSICLHPHATPKVTRCGHLFCNVCILKHLSYAENWMKSCPLCSELVSKSDLKSVDIREVKPCVVETFGKFQLITRRKHSVICRPQSRDCSEEDPQIVHDSRPFFSRVVIGDEEYLLDILQREAKELRHALAQDASLKPLVDLALGDVKARKAKVQQRKKRRRKARPTDMQAKETESFLLNANPANVTLSNNNFDRKRDGAIPSEDDPQETNTKDSRYFYQFDDSQMCFCHPVNVKMILHETDGFKHAFPSIEGEILEIERYTMNTDLRKRYKFMSHVPDGCEFTFAELDLSSTLSKETLLSFGPELKARSMARKRKIRATKREDRKREKKETELLRRHVEEQSGPLTVRVEEVNGGDPTVFPSLDQKASTRVDRKASTPGSAWGGSEISSYASITNSMGLFPELSRATGSQNTTPSEPNELEDETPPKGLVSGTIDGSSGATKGWATLMKEDSAKSQRQAPRRGRKPTVIFSNAAGPRRR